MAGQDQIRPQGGGSGAGANDAGQIAPQGLAHSAEVDDILSEIDSVLESNAEEFVKSFVQKGGQ